MATTDELNGEQCRKLSQLVRHLEEQLSQNEMDRLYRFGARNPMNDPRNCVGADIATMVACRSIYETEGKITTKEVHDLLQLLTERDVSQKIVATPTVKTEIQDLHAVKTDGGRLVMVGDSLFIHVVRLNRLSLRDNYDMEQALDLNEFKLIGMCGLQFDDHVAYTHVGKEFLTQNHLYHISIPGIGSRPVCEKCIDRLQSERSLEFGQVL